MTRVQKINKAIEILHVEKGLDAKQIHAYLAERKIYVELHTITQVVLSLNYVAPVKLNIPRRSKLQIRIERLVNALKPVLDLHHKARCPLRYLSQVLNGLGITVPGTGAFFTHKKLLVFLKLHNIHKRSQLSSNNYTLTFQEYSDMIDPVLEPLKEYAAWVQEGN